MWQLWVQSWCELLGLQGRAAPAGRDPQWGWIGLDRQLYRPHQGWPSGHSHFTGEEVSVGFQCHAGVTLATTLLNPCPPHLASLITSIHYVPIYASLPFPPPLRSSCHHGPVRSQTVRTLFHCCKCHLSYTLSAFHRRPFIRHPFKKTPAHISCFLIFTMCQRTLFLPIHSMPYDNTHIFSVNARISFPASYFCFLLCYSRLCNALVLSVFK